MNRRAKIPIAPGKAREYSFETINSDVKYQNLISQLNPHFLFNSLATLESLIHSDPRLAVKFLSQLTRVYRYILSTRDTPLVTLTDELSFIRDYADLLQTRFGKGLKIHIKAHTNSKVLQAQIVPAVLQILVENATRHNITDPDSPLCISIEVAGYALVIENNLQKKQILEAKRQETLQSLGNLYNYLSTVPLTIEQTESTFRVIVPLLNKES
ncbi:histidine kinase [Runella sp. MFBS21]|uniref:sensor histidine kinase n=1 Tax=Runella sp. MFBS21 TaxID=3034018 RepID=UPI0023F6E187|nr:histidine kinase [Runella sp. MFBS21]MDF7817026.1 histidine kinase [Runella sp. MFBS21]